MSYELTNTQRPCFGLKPVEPGWVPMVLKPSPYFPHTTIAYRDGLTLRKYVASGEDQYVETELNEQLSEDLRYLLPKTGRGKPVLLTAASLEKRGGTGMCLRWLKSPRNLSLWHEESQHVWYDVRYENRTIDTIEDFAVWVEDWCADTTPDDLDALVALRESRRVHVKYREGDVFRFRLTRRLWGYGRILLDYRAMKKRKEPLISDFLAGSVECAVYHIATERRDVTAEELEKLPCLPSSRMADNRIYYGDYEIIGHLPIREKEAFPILYDHHFRGNEVVFQFGRLYRSLPGAQPVAEHFSGIYHSHWLDVRLSVLLECIKNGNNDSYWSHKVYGLRARDLRDPRFRAELEKVCAQMGVEIADLI